MHFAANFNYFDIMAATKKSYARILEPICRERELTRNELDVILFLYNNPEFDRAADIVSHRGIAKSHVSLSVASLEEKGLLTKAFDENDRRMAHLRLTELAKQIASQAREVQQRFFSALYEGITEEDFRLWRSITERVCNNIREIDNTLSNLR